MEGARGLYSPFETGQKSAGADVYINEVLHTRLIRGLIRGLTFLMARDPGGTVHQPPVPGPCHGPGRAVARDQAGLCRSQRHVWGHHQGDPPLNSLSHIPLTPYLLRRIR